MANDLWTAARVAGLIRRHFGVRHHPEHVRKLLKRRMRWASQRPQKRAAERDEGAIARWLAEEFPKVRGETARRAATLVFLDESGFRLTPVVRRTLAPRGVTPVVRAPDRRDRISAVSAVTVRPSGREGRYFRLLPTDANARAEDVVAFLRQLRGAVPGPLTVVWDGSPIHGRSRTVRRWLAEHPEVVAVRLPACAPELNPDELVWQYAKYSRLANYAPADAGELRGAVRRELWRLKGYPWLLRSFVDHCKLGVNKAA